jgi:NTE family protein
MGAIIGALYSIGYSTQEMEELLNSLNWPELLANTPDYRLLSMIEKPWANRYLATFYLNKGGLQLPSGLNSGQNIAMLLSRLTWPVHHVPDFSQFPIPFVCVATDMETGEAVALRQGFLPEALRASASIPTVFSPVRLDGRLLVVGQGQATGGDQANGQKNATVHGGSTNPD